jgi:hypothetical protein
MAFFKNLRKYYNDLDLYNSLENIKQDKIATLNTKIISVLKQTIFDKSNIRMMQQLCVSQFAFTLDMYFFMRSHKEELLTESPRKLICGYLGYRHVEAAQYYYVHVLKTHKSGYFVNSNIGERFIHIKKPIQLNQWFNHIPKSNPEFIFKTIPITKEENDTRDLQLMVKKADFITTRRNQLKTIRKTRKRG